MSFWSELCSINLLSSFQILVCETFLPFAPGEGCRLIRLPMLFRSVSCFIIGYFWPLGQSEKCLHNRINFLMSLCAGAYYQRADACRHRVDTFYKRADAKCLCANPFCRRVDARCDCANPFCRCADAFCRCADALYGCANAFCRCADAVWGCANPFLPLCRRRMGLCEPFLPLCRCCQGFF